MLQPPWNLQYCMGLQCFKELQYITQRRGAVLSNPPIPSDCSPAFVKTEGAGRGRGRGVKYFFPLQAENGTWHVAYQDFRGQIVGVMECPSLRVATMEAAAMTYRAMTGKAVAA